MKENKAATYGGITVCGNPISKYTIVRPHFNLSYIVGREIERLRETIYERTGIRLQIVTDICDSQAYEIIIGTCDRKDTIRTAKKNTYEIRVETEKVFINGDTEITCAAATDKFIAMIESSDEPHSEYGTAVETGDGYRLVWNDEFDRTQLDTSKWHIVDRTFGSSVPEVSTCFCARPENLSVKDGSLQMTAGYDGEKYYGCEIESKYSMWYQYGYVEISARVPGQKGMVPAFWSRGEGEEIWPEIDFFECLGNPEEIKGTMLGWKGTVRPHGWSTYVLSTEKFPESATYYHIPKEENLYDEYHTIGFYWDETSAVWTCDGVEYARCDELCANEKFKATFHTPIHLLLSMQTAVNNYGFPPPDNTTDWSKGTFSIDYVRLYQKKNQLLKLSTK